MIEHADQLGANAIIGVRYDATEIADGVTEVLAYGTAVYCRSISWIKNGQARLELALIKHETLTTGSAGQLATLLTGLTSCRSLRRSRRSMRRSFRLIFSILRSWRKA